MRLTPSSRCVVLLCGKRYFYDVDVIAEATTYTRRGWKVRVYLVFKRNSNRVSGGSAKDVASLLGLSILVAGKSRPCSDTHTHT